MVHCLGPRIQHLRVQDVEFRIQGLRFSGPSLRFQGLPFGA